MMIIYARRIIEEVYGDREYDTECHGPVLTKAEYVYGDSVANYTPVYVRVNNIADSDEMKMDICTIESLAEKYGTAYTEYLNQKKKEELNVNPLEILSNIE